ncbi:MAG: 2-polyprenyl-3-methyl-6-methoxy-1,4-benzoquinone monooxygenase [Burkholderiales bacterium]|nr:2-polyprenyl-3-methyl-6-methoxy-1,4-benzoquinone monooxygenase [Burkholderiales bacterium]
MDRLLTALDTALRTLWAPARAVQPSPAHDVADSPLAAADRQLSAALMRVNHVGEVCAQALYTGQAAVTHDKALRQQMLEAAREETDHLAWTQERIRALGGRESLLNPLWFAGAFGLGVLAASVSDKVSLGFVAETEDQVAAHLDSHLQRLPAQDTRSRTIVARMKSDEERHAAWARRSGAVELPAPARWLMRAAAKVMTTTAHHI